MVAEPNLVLVTMGHLVLVVVLAAFTNKAVGYRDLALIKAVLAALVVEQFSKQMCQMWAVMVAQLLAMAVAVVRLVVAVAL